MTDTELTRRGEKTRLELARQAFEERDVEMSKLTHAQPAREDHASGGEFVKSVAFGGLDGIITTFAIVCTVAGAGKPPGYVLLFGVANLVADALSMGVGDFLSTKSEIDFSRVERSRERWELENHALGEIEEMIAIYEQKGFSSADARQIIETMAKNEEFFLDHVRASRDLSSSSETPTSQRTRLLTDGPNLSLPLLRRCAPSSSGCCRPRTTTSATRSRTASSPSARSSRSAACRCSRTVRVSRRASTCLPRRSSPARAPSSSWLSSGSA